MNPYKKLKKQMSIYRMVALKEDLYILSIYSTVWKCFEIIKLQFYYAVRGCENIYKSIMSEFFKS